MGKLRGQIAAAGGGPTGRSASGRYQQQIDMTMTPPPANRLLNHHGSLSSADSSILYNTSHPTSPLLQRSPMHQKHPRPRHTSVNRHGVVALEDDDLDLLQPVYQEPYQVSNYNQMNLP